MRSQDVGRLKVAERQGVKSLINGFSLLRHTDCKLAVKQINKIVIQLNIMKKKNYINRWT